MRHLAVLALVLLAMPATAQHWNDSGPGRDLLSSTTAEFEFLRQRLPGTPSFGTTTAGIGAAPAQSRGQIPILDWVPPPPAAAAPAPRRASAPRAAPRPRQDPVMRDPAPLPAAAPLQSGSDWDRSFGERERELERLRQILEQDRLRFQQSRQPQLR